MLLRVVYVADVVPRARPERDFVHWVGPGMIKAQEVLPGLLEALQTRALPTPPFH